MKQTTDEQTKAPTISELVQRERSLQKELNELRKKLARMVSSESPDSAALHPLEKDHTHHADEEDSFEAEVQSRFAYTAAIEKESPLPSILLRPLSLQDPLRSKWHLGLGLAAPNDPLQPPSATVSPAYPLNLDEAPAVRGHLRIFGLLPSGMPCQCKIALDKIARDGQMIIGRDPSVAQIVIPDIGVSRAHAVLEYIADQLVISDNKSTNGLFLNGHRLSHFETRMPLYDGCMVNFGEIKMRVEISQ